MKEKKYICGFFILSDRPEKKWLKALLSLSIVPVVFQGQGYFYICPTVL